MIGLIKLTSATDGIPFWVNPQHISALIPGRSDLLKSVGVTRHSNGNTCVLIGSLFTQTVDTPKDIVSALTRLKNLQIEELKKMRKAVDREDWQRNDTDLDDEII